MQLFQFKYPCDTVALIKSHFHIIMIKQHNFTELFKQFIRASETGRRVKKKWATY